MTKAEIMVTEAFRSIQNDIFVRWMVREGRNQTLAEQEVVRLNSVETEAQYLRVQRTGSRFPLTRRDRESIWSLYENAGRHAMYEIAPN